MRITNTGTLLVSTTTASGLSNGTTNYGHSFGGGQQGGAQTAVMPWQIQVDATQANDRTPSEQAAALAGLQSTLSSQLQAVNSTLTDLEPQTLAVQQSKQEAETENARLVRNYTLAEETYSALASKVEEERITSQDVNSGVKLVGKTAVPSEPTKPSLFLNVLVAMMLGFAVGIVFVFYKFVNN